MHVFLNWNACVSSKKNVRCWFELNEFISLIMDVVLTKSQMDIRYYALFCSDATKTPHVAL